MCNICDDVLLLVMESVVSFRKDEGDPLKKPAEKFTMSKSPIVKVPGFGIRVGKFGAVREATFV